MCLLQIRLLVKPDLRNSHAHAQPGICLDRVLRKEYLTPQSRVDTTNVVASSSLRNRPLTERHLLHMSSALIKKGFWLVLLVCIAGCQAPDQSTGISTTHPAVDSSSTAEAPSFNLRSQAYQLSYIQSGDIWLVDLSHPEILPRQVTEVGSIVRYGWAPDGSAFWYETLPGKLTVVDLSSGGEHAIAGETNAEATWSPDSAGIVYVSTIPDAGWSIGSPAYRTEVSFFDRTSLETTRLLDGTEPDLILDPPVRLQTWSMPRWNYARPL